MPVATHWEKKKSHFIKVLNVFSDNRPQLVLVLLQNPVELNPLYNLSLLVPQSMIPHPLQHLPVTSWVHFHGDPATVTCLNIDACGHMGSM